MNGNADDLAAVIEALVAADCPENFDASQRTNGISIKVVTVISRCRHGREQLMFAINQIVRRGTFSSCDVASIV